MAVNSTTTTQDETETHPERGLGDDVYDRILLKIIRGEIRPGEPLKSTQLAKSLDVSRTPVIQALRRLGDDGIVYHELNQPPKVRKGAEDWLVHIHELRLLLEPFAAAQAVGAIDADTMFHLKKLGERAAPRCSEDWIARAKEFDYALHLAIADACGNLPLAQAIRKCWDYKRISYQHGHDSTETIKRGYWDHLAILEAINAGDRQGAEAAMRCHLLNAVRYTRRPRII